MSVDAQGFVRRVMSHQDQRTEVALRRLLGLPVGVRVDPGTMEGAAAQAAADGLHVARFTNEPMWVQIRDREERTIWEGRWTLVGFVYEWHEEWTAERRGP